MPDNKTIEARNKQAVLEGVKWFNDRNMEAFLATIPEDAVWRSATVGLHGFEVFGKRGVQGMLEAIWNTLEDVQIGDVKDLVAEGDKVWVDYTMSGPGTRSFMGLPECDKPFKYVQSVLNVFRPHDGMRVESVFFWSPLQVLEWQGHVPMIAPYSMPGHQQPAAPPPPAESARGEWASAEVPGHDHHDHPVETMTRTLSDLVELPFVVVSRALRRVLRPPHESRWS